MTSRRFFQNFVSGMFGIFILLGVNDVSAKNPFQSFLPEKPKEEPKSAIEEPDKIRTAAVEPPKVEAPVIPPALVLKGLIWNSSRPQAIIEGQIVQVGDIVREVKIMKISRDGVEGDFKGVKVFLKP